MTFLYNPRESVASLLETLLGEATSQPEKVHSIATRLVSAALNSLKLPYESRLDSSHPNRGFCVGDTDIYIVHSFSESIVPSFSEDPEKGRRPLFLTIETSRQLADTASQSNPMTSTIERIDIKTFVISSIIRVMPGQAKALQQSILNFIAEFNATDPTGPQVMVSP